MKKVIIISLLTLSFLYSAAPPLVYSNSDTQTYQSYLSQLESILITEIKNQQLNRLLTAFIMQESRGNAMAYNKPEGAAGILQIRKIMLDHINAISGKNFTMNDRFDPKKSKEMFIIVMNKHNPDYDLKKAALTWNGRGKDGKGSARYYREIKQKHRALI